MPTSKSIVSELVNKRTLNSKHYLLSDGSYQADISIGQIHFDDGEGNLHNINTDLFDEADFHDFNGPVNQYGKQIFSDIKQKVIDARAKGTLNRDNFDYQGLQVPFEVKIPRNFKRGYTIGKGVDKLTFKPVGASPAKGYVEADSTNKIHYQDAWNDADVILELTDRGIKETITLKTDRAPSSFSFEVDGNLADDLTAGELHLQPAWLEDAAGTKRDVTQTVRRDTTNNKVYVDMVTDVTGLVYPIVIDPTVTIQSDTSHGKDAYVDSSSPDQVSGTGTGMYLGRGPSGGSGAYLNPLLSFDLSSIPVGSVCSSSSVKFNGYGASSNNLTSFFQNVTAYLFTSNWDEASVSWNNKPSTTLIGLMTLSGSSVTAPSGSGATYTFDGLKNYINEYAGQSNNPGFMFQINGAPNSYAQELVLYTREYQTQSYRPSLTVTYNAPPTAPTVTSPNGGESWNSQETVTYTASTDPDTAQSSLQYQIQLSTDNGVTWKDIVALTAAGATSYPYDFINETESSTCLIRIRAYDGSAYGPWDQSDGVFTIQHNQAPTGPTNLSPSGGTSVDRALVNRFSWQHNDPNSNDPQSKFDLQWRPKVTQTWNTVTQSTPNQYYDMPANTLSHGDIEWQVRTYDQAGLSGPYSALATFLAGDKPTAPTITSPADGSTVAVANPTVQWSSSGQTGYTLSVKDSVGTQVYSASGTTNKAHTVQYDLANQSNYFIDVTINNADNLASDFDSAGITVSYTPPADPILSTQIDSDRGSITLMIDNPVPTGTEPNVSYNDVYRRKQGDADFIRMATNLPNDSSFTDFTPASGQVYEYMVRVWGDNGTFNDSAIIIDSVAVSNAQLALTTDYSQVAYVVLNNQSGGPQRDFKHSVDRSMMQFAGRESPVAEFSEFDDWSAGLSFIVQTKADIDMLCTLAYCRQTLLYRDSRGRREFVTIDGLEESDLPFRNEWYSVSVNPLRVSYDEEI